MFSASSDGQSSIIQSHVPVIDRILTAAPASVCRSEKDLVQFPASTSCEKALLALNRAGITGAPVYSDITGASTDGMQASPDMPLVLEKVVYTGFVDVADISLLMLTKGLKRAPASSVMGRLASWFRPDVEHQVGHAMNMSGLDPFRWVPMSANLKEAAKLLTTSGAHRVAVFDNVSSHRIRGIVTPCGILRAIRDNISELGELGGVPVGALFDVQRGSVLCAHQDASARKSLKSMLARGYTGMPVVDDNGAMVTALSFSHLRAVATLKPQAALKALQEHSSLWLATRNADGEEDVLAVQRNMTVAPSDSLATAITILAFSRAHRMYIVDGDRRPVGIITIRSLIRLLLSQQITVRPGWHVKPGGTAWLRMRSMLDRVPPSDSIKQILHSTTLLSFIKYTHSMVDFTALPSVTRLQTIKEVMQKLAANAAAGKLSRGNFLAVTKHAAPTPLTAASKGSASIVPVMPSASYVGWVEPVTVLAARLMHPDMYDPGLDAVAHIMNFDLHEVSRPKLTQSMSSAVSLGCERGQDRDSDADSRASSVTPPAADGSGSLPDLIRSTSPALYGQPLMMRTCTSTGVGAMPHGTVHGDHSGYKRVPNPSGRYCHNPFWSLSMGSGMDQALQMLAARSLSRLAVVDTSEAGRPVVGVIQRSTVLKELGHYIGNFGAAIAELKVKTMIDRHPESHVCASEASLEDALVMMISNELHGLPIVDAEGCLVAFLTLKDIEHLAFLSNSELEAAKSEPVLKYLSAHQATASTRDVWVSAFPITLRPHDCFASAVEIMAAADLCSVCVVDADMKPLGVLNDVDILKVIAL